MTTICSQEINEIDRLFSDKVYLADFVGRLKNPEHCNYHHNGNNGNGHDHQEYCELIKDRVNCGGVWCKPVKWYGQKGEEKKGYELICNHRRELDID